MSMMTVMLFLCFNVTVEHISHCSGVSIVDFEEINASWKVFQGLKKTPEPLHISFSSSTSSSKLSSV